VVNTIKPQLKGESIHNRWKEIIRTMNDQKAGTTLTQNIHDALKYKYAPFVKKNM
jgi:hypothetical protein